MLDSWSLGQWVFRLSIVLLQVVSFWPDSWRDAGQLGDWVKVQVRDLLGSVAGRYKAQEDPSGLLEEPGIRR